ncbi:MAG: holo-ACP synthase [Nitrospirae bacterium]|nr:holo-ACP synthase [Nitrospirota bacterium]
MIYGIGIDMVRVDRVKELSEKWGGRFNRRVFTESEIAYCNGKKNPYLSLAVRFAAKEAMVKAIGSRAFIDLTDIEVVNSDTGKPFIKISGKLKEFFKQNGIKNCHLSLSHEREYGVACVVLES